MCPLAAVVMAMAINCDSSKYKGEQQHSRYHAPYNHWLNHNLSLLILPQKYNRTVDRRNTQQGISLLPL